MMTVIHGIGCVNEMKIELLMPLNVKHESVVMGCYISVSLHQYNEKRVTIEIR